MVKHKTVIVALFDIPHLEETRSRSHFGKRMIGRDVATTRNFSEPALCKAQTVEISNAAYCSFLKSGFSRSLRVCALGNGSRNSKIANPSGSALTTASNRALTCTVTSRCRTSTFLHWPLGSTGASSTKCAIETKYRVLP